MKIHVKIQGKSFAVKIGDIHARPIQAEVDGEIFEVWPEETLVPSETSFPISSTPQVAHPVQPIDTDGSHAKSKGKSSSLIAPIPGVIVEISANVGDAVAYGQELCVLEAMKMKNSIRANKDGVIKKIFIAIGDHVSQSQILMEFDSEEK
ncbi:MAG: biotin/lipoyl-containing protein [Pelolinea sp.]|nr:biotin/lipoyl-containing protein [Pelolinea sp.]